MAFWCALRVEGLLDGFLCDDLSSCAVRVLMPPVMASIFLCCACGVLCTRCCQTIPSGHVCAPGVLPLTRERYGLGLVVCTTRGGPSRARNERMRSEERL